MHTRIVAHTPSTRLPHVSTLSPLYLHSHPGELSFLERAEAVLEARQALIESCMWVAIIPNYSPW